MKGAVRCCSHSRVPRQVGGTAWLLLRVAEEPGGQHCVLGARCGVVQKDRLQPPASVLPWEVLVPLTVVTKEQSLALLPDLPHDPPNLWVEETAYEGRVSSLRVCSWPLPWPIVPFTVLAAHWEVSEQIVELLRGRCGRSSTKKSDFGSCCSLSITVVPGQDPWERVHRL